MQVGVKPRGGAGRSTRAGWEWQNTPETKGVRSRKLVPPRKREVVLTDCGKNAMEKIECFGWRNLSLGLWDDEQCPSPVVPICKVSKRAA